MEAKPAYREERGLEPRLTGCQFTTLNHWWRWERMQLAAQLLKHGKVDKIPCFVIIHVAELELLPFHLTPRGIWALMTVTSPDQQAERSGLEAKMWRLSAERRRSRLVHVLRPVGLWSVCSPGHTDEQEEAPFEDLNHLLLIRLLRRRSVPPRLKSNVTEAARVLLPLKVMRCIDSRLWQQKADGSDTQRIIACFSFQRQPKKNRIWQARPGKLFRVCGRNLATFSDTWHILESGCLRSLGRGRRGKTDIFSRWRSDAGCRLVQRQQVQHFRVLPTEQTISFRETSGSSLHLVKLGYLSFLQPSAEEKCFYFEIPAWINH